MIKYLTKYRASLAAILILAPLLLWFFYSEIGQYTIEKENPATQDYCKVVQVIKVEAGEIAVSDLFKLKVDKSFAPHFIDVITVHFPSFYELSTKALYTPQKTTQIYLFNSTFLI